MQKKLLKGIIIVFIVLCPCLKTQASIAPLAPGQQLDPLQSGSGNAPLHSGTFSSTFTDFFCSILDFLGDLFPDEKTIIREQQDIIEGDIIGPIQKEFVNFKDEMNTFLNKVIDIQREVERLIPDVPDVVIRIPDIPSITIPDITVTSPAPNPPSSRSVLEEISENVAADLGLSKVREKRLENIEKSISTTNKLLRGIYIQNDSLLKATIQLSTPDQALKQALLKSLEEEQKRIRREELANLNKRLALWDIMEEEEEEIYNPYDI